MEQTLNFILDGSEVVRYHTITTLQRETVGHHSHGVAMLALVLEPLASRQLLMAALFHDLAEHKTGDIPSPAKREFGIGQKVEELEFRLMRESGIIMPELSPHEARVLKLADVAQGALFCLREARLGNSRILTVFERYMSYADEMILCGREHRLFNLIRNMSR